MLCNQIDKQAVVFLKDVKFVDLKALVEYMYRGEVNVAQDQLATFLSTAEALKIKGNSSYNPSTVLFLHLFIQRFSIQRRQYQRNSSIVKE